MNRGDSAISAWILSRGIALVALIAFLSALVQIRGLIGVNGLLPVGRFLEFLGTRLGADAFFRMPTLFWISASDEALLSVALIGAAAAIAALLGMAAPVMFAICFACYLAIVVGGQDFFSFQWDVLLLETLFLAIFLGPWPLRLSPGAAPEPHLIVKALFFLLLFKLMFLSGAVKIASGDPAWKSLTALIFHYETQPLANPLSWFFHQLPAGFHKFSAAVMFFTELALPFAIFVPRAPARVAAAAGFVGLMLLIFVSGNYTFFNLLTIVLSLFLIPDSWWSRLSTFSFLETAAAPGAIFAGVAGAIAVPLVLTHLFWLARPFDSARGLTSVLTPVVRFLMPFHVNNSYGLFAVMTTSRPELDVQGSDDGVNWKSYVFKYKPGPLDRWPSQVAPHQPRLDWQMWFAALGDPANTDWLTNLQLRLLQGEPTVLALIGENPFPEKPPRYVRVLSADYRFTTPAERASSGNVWKKSGEHEAAPALILHR